MSQITATPTPRNEPGEEPVLKHLSPALRELERGLRLWLDGRRRYPLSTEARAELERQAGDLRRKADDLLEDKPLLVIVLMGGTGVGKSTLFNALAGDAVAQASFQRPTTRDPVVYFYHSVRTDRLDPALSHCRLVPHDHKALEQKIIVDTPDLDSNDLSNREKLARILPVADVVLYVGSQEKYHDKLGWDLFRQQRQRRAFAFVLNKWDRCTHAFSSGLRPDEDLLRDLRSEGFEKPLLFRTCAQTWLDYRQSRKRQGVPESAVLDGKPEGLPEGEQFSELLHWLELGITGLEIEAIKARGVDQSLKQLSSALTQVAPPDLTQIAERTVQTWNKVLAEEADSVAEVLMHTLEPYQREIEHHFALEGQRRFQGLMAWWLGLANRLKYVGSQLKSRIPLAGRMRDDDKPAAWDLASFTRACSEVAANRSLDGRVTALTNRLLVEADGQGFPLSVLSEPVEATARQDWRQQHAQTMVEALHEVEQAWTQPSGGRGLLQGAFIALCNWAPPVALLSACALLLWRFFVEGQRLTLGDGLLPVIVLVVALIIFQVLIALLLPLRWSAIRGEFQRALERHVRQELEKVYGKIPITVSEGLKEERRQVEVLLGKVSELEAWLQRREQAASIAGLYGH